MVVHVAVAEVGIPNEVGDGTTMRETIVPRGVMTAVGRSVLAVRAMLLVQVVMAVVPMVVVLVVVLLLLVRMTIPRLGVTRMIRIPGRIKTVIVTMTVTGRGLTGITVTTETTGTTNDGGTGRALGTAEAAEWETEEAVEWEIEEDTAEDAVDSVVGVVGSVVGAADSVEEEDTNSVTHTAWTRLL